MRSKSCQEGRRRRGRPRASATPGSGRRRSRSSPYIVSRFDQVEGGHRRAITARPTLDCSGVATGDRSRRPVSCLLARPAGRSASAVGSPASAASSQARSRSIRQRVRDCCSVCSTSSRSWRYFLRASRVLGGVEPDVGPAFALSTSVPGLGLLVLGEPVMVGDPLDVVSLQLALSFAGSSMSRPLTSGIMPRN